MSPTASKTAVNNAPRSRTRQLRSAPPGYALHDRPNSMFELRPPMEIGDLTGFRRRSRAVADEESEEESSGEETNDEMEGLDVEQLHNENRRGGRRRGGGELGDGEAAHWGDDEEDGEGEGEVQSVAAGLGLEGRPL